MKKLVLPLALATLGLAASQSALANATLTNPAAAGGTAQATLDFRVTVPRVLYLQVGTGTPFTTSGTTDLIDITLSAATAIGGGTQAASAGSGDQTNGAVTIRVFGNGTTGNISLNSSTTGQMNNGAAVTIPWTSIAVATAALGATTPGFTNGAITHPTFNNTAGGGNGTATTLTPVSNIVAQEGKWTFSYTAAAGTFAPAGTYGGVNANNGRVTYTATMP